jgi:hypothetical protein
MAARPDLEGPPSDRTANRMRQRQVENKYSCRTAMADEERIREVPGIPVSRRKERAPARKSEEQNPDIFLRKDSRSGSTASGNWRQ